MEEPKIIAVKNGKIREFTRKMWDLIGTDKYGWVPVEQTAPPPVPKEVKEAIVYPPGSGVETGFPGFTKPAKRKKK